MDFIKKNIFDLKHKISKSEIQYNRPKNSVLLMAVSKTQSPENIIEAFNAGQRDFGENYIQESIEKISKLKKLDIIWHYIGKIQSNKSKIIANNYDWVHSVDKISTLKKINNYRCDSKNKINICIQVNIDYEDSKSGIAPEEVEFFINDTIKLDKVNIRGLMAIPMHQADHGKQYQTFMKIKNLFDELVNKGYKLDTLSIGMSSDYEAAIAAGSSIVRIGTAIFGERKK